MRVLLVEDDDALAVAVILGLSQEHLAVDRAKTLAEAGQLPTVCPDKDRSSPYGFGSGQPGRLWTGVGAGVAHGGFDTEPEEVAEAADVTAGGVDLLEDAVFSQRLGSEVRLGLGELFADGGEARAALAGDEQVRVDAHRAPERGPTTAS